MLLIWAEADGVPYVLQAEAAGGALPYGAEAGENDVFGTGILPNNGTCGTGNIPSGGKSLYKIQEKNQKQPGLTVYNIWFL